MLVQFFSAEVSRTLITPMEVITSTTPVLAALVARRSLREPAGVLALGWGLSTVGSLLKVAMNAHYLPTTLAWHRLEILLVTACLLYGGMQWIDGVSQRTRWLVVAGWCAVCALMLPIPTRREFLLLNQPLQAAIILLVSGLALASRVRAADGALGRLDWFWLLPAHITYFSVTLIRMPLQESLVRHHWDLGYPVYFGVMFVYAASYLVIARGMLLTGSERRPTTRGVPFTRPA